MNAVVTEGYSALECDKRSGRVLADVSGKLVFIYSEDESCHYRSHDFQHGDPLSILDQLMRNFQSIK